MTEQEWMTSTDPQAMLEELIGAEDEVGTGTSLPAQRHAICTDRKLRSLAATCCRLKGRTVTAQMMEQFVETGKVPDGYVRSWGEGSAINDAFAWILPTNNVIGADPEDVAEALRCIFGNPFSPIVLPLVAYGGVVPVSATTARLKVRSMRCPWITRDVLDIAEGVYANRSDNGSLDPIRLSILADALEEAGCDDQRLVDHLRDAKPHFLGCHSLDAILSKR